MRREPNLDRDRLAYLARQSAAMQSLARDDLNALVEQFDERDARIASLEADLARAAEAAAKVEISGRSRMSWRYGLPSCRAICPRHL